MVCKHDIAYYGVLIKNFRGITSALDVWKCRRCSMLFVEKRLEMQNLR
jgi:hypothetical protein